MLKLISIINDCVLYLAIDDGCLAVEDRVDDVGIRDGRRAVESRIGDLRMRGARSAIHDRMVERRIGHVSRAVDDRSNEPRGPPDTRASTHRGIIGDESGWRYGSGDRHPAAAIAVDESLFAPARSLLHDGGPAFGFGAGNRDAVTRAGLVDAGHRPAAGNALSIIADRIGLRERTLQRRQQQGQRDHQADRSSPDHYPTDTSHRRILLTRTRGRFRSVRHKRHGAGRFTNNCLIFAA